MGDILDDLIGLGLADSEIVLFSAVLVKQFDEGFNGERIVLGGDAELVLDRSSSKVSLLDQTGLLDDLSGISEKFFSLGGDENALIGALKNRDAKFVFQFVNRGGQTGLGD